MKKTDLEKIDYIGHINSKDVISRYHRKVAKGYIQELYDEAIREHNEALRRFERHEITYDEIGNIQNNCIVFIRVLRQLNSKHKLLERLID